MQDSDVSITYQRQYTLEIFENSQKTADCSWVQSTSYELYAVTLSLRERTPNYTEHTSVFQTP
jgi:hypothetical protein